MQSLMRSASLNAIMHALIRTGNGSSGLYEGDEEGKEALMADYLLFATERYALPILQPLALELQAAGHGVHALFVDGAAGAVLPAPVRMVDLRDAVALKPRAVFSAANWVPPFIAGALRRTCRNAPGNFSDRHQICQNLIEALTGTAPLPAWTIPA